MARMMAKKRAEKLRAVDEAALTGDWVRFYKLQRKSSRSIMTQAKRSIEMMEAFEATHPESDYSAEKRLLADAWDRAKAVELESIAKLDELKEEQKSE